MTEAEWREAGELRTMMEFIRQRTSGASSACSPSPASASAPPARRRADRHRAGDGQAVRRRAGGPAGAAGGGGGGVRAGADGDLRTTASAPTWAAARAAARAATLDPFAAAMGAAYVSVLAHVPWVFDDDGRTVHRGDEVARAEVWRRQCDLLREIIGNPFRPGWLSAEWLRWNDEIVARLAAEIFQTGRYDELPVLADALEDAGCDCRDLLDHLRRPGGHVHGCWALDLLLGR
ncbi:MAG: hypothetical protein U0736_13915 [Gemmataceae bacterium]